uniref:SWIM-type domain-containing protein n=1 Tax=Chromera velia CCMP2878 TaxID=1169474 RepID=A0A0G4FY71_9ALVE|eukprot:Cvel_19358.t1-p1 / transcript=Cvel_19358.t1 / gene=Cvel_19358 / organism=Chromera_velia_CCMP2878 / gene_product=hypothetical protein / transcript_product=hypothetical protein / location=Cvel_scaffold1663:8140-23903(-) / protein_length=3482 / sequence_SO=supercontig / SO=protein_coding / is_pseudo=false
MGDNFWDNRGAWDPTWGSGQGSGVRGPQHPGWVRADPGGPPLLAPSGAPGATGRDGWGLHGNAPGWNPGGPHMGRQVPPPPPSLMSNPNAVIREDPSSRLHAPHARHGGSDRRDYTLESSYPQIRFPGGGNLGGRNTGQSHWQAAASVIPPSPQVPPPPQISSLNSHRHQLTQRLKPLSLASPHAAGWGDYELGQLIPMLGIQAGQARKAVDIARLGDGILQGETTTDPAVFSVWSKSANCRHVDMDVSECSCPNPHFFCSHLLAVVSALPVYRMKFALLTLAKIAIVRDKRRSSLEIAHHVLDLITHWFPSPRQREELAPAAVWAFVGLLWRFFQKSGDVPVAIKKDEPEGDDDECKTKTEHGSMVAERHDILRASLEVFREMQEAQRTGGDGEGEGDNCASSFENFQKCISRLDRFRKDVCTRLGKGQVLTSELSESIASVLFSAMRSRKDEKDETLTQLREYIFGRERPLSAANETSVQEGKEKGDSKNGEGAPPTSQTVSGTTERMAKQKQSAEILKQKIVAEVAQAASEGLGGLSLLQKVERSLVAELGDEDGSREEGKSFSFNDLTLDGRSFIEFLQAEEKEGGAGVRVREVVESAAFGSFRDPGEEPPLSMESEGSLPLSSVFGRRLKRLAAAVAVECSAVPAELERFGGERGEGPLVLGQEVSGSLERFCTRLPVAVRRYFALDCEADGERESALRSVGISSPQAAARLAAEALGGVNEPRDFLHGLGPVPLSAVLVEGGSERREEKGRCSRAEALAALKRLPPLEDVQEGTAWSHRFQESLGPLRNFLDRYSQEIGRQAVETVVGRFALLLPLDQVSVETFGMALRKRNARKVVSILLDFLLAGKGESLRTLLSEEAREAMQEWEAKDAREFLCGFVDVTPDLALVSHKLVVDWLWRPLKDQMPSSFARACIEAGRRAGACEGTDRDPESAALLPARLGSVLAVLAFSLNVPEWRDLTAQKPPLPGKSPPSVVEGGDGPVGAVEFPSAAPTATAMGIRTGVSEDVGVPDFPRPDSSSALAIVESIRREEFGVGVVGEGEGEASKVFRSQRDRLTRALKRLSEDLYSGEIHLVMELIQNADDNRYAPGVTPTMAFLVTPRGLAAFVNETGFSEADFRAICDIGKSTKTKQTGGGGAAIGKFGIGFKSVFSLSDSPHLFSAGFSIKFEAHDPSGIGYILPHWVNEPPKVLIHPGERPRNAHARPVWVDTAPPGPGGTRWTTILWLPAKEDLLNGPGKRWDTVLSAKMSSLSASWLLFLRKVSVIWLHTEVGTLTVGGFSRDVHTEVTQSERERGKVLRIQKRARKAEALPPRLCSLGVSVIDLKTSVFSEDSQELHNLSCTETWMVVPSKAQVPSAFRGGQAGQAPALFTVLQVALPLGEAGEALVSSSSRDFPVFAYLPLRSFGFRFILQGDFRVPASRESVIEGDSRNEFLRESIPSAFVAAVQACKSLLFPGDLLKETPERKDGTSRETESLPALSRAALSFLHFVPRPGELSEFFAPCSSSIIRELRGDACILDDGGEWRLPAEVRRLREGTSAFVESLLQDVCEGREERPKMVHPVFAQSSPSEVLEALGVPIVGLWDLMDLLHRCTGESCGSEHRCSPGWVGRLLALLDLLAREGDWGGRGEGRAETFRFFRVLSRVSFLPLRNGSTVAPCRNNGEAAGNERIYFEVEQEEERESERESEGVGGDEGEEDLLWHHEHPRKSDLPASDCVSSVSVSALHDEVLSLSAFRESAERVVEREARWRGDKGGDRESEAEHEREEQVLRVAKDLQTSAIRTLEHLKLRRLTKEALVHSVLLNLTQRPEMVFIQTDDHRNRSALMGKQDAQVLAFLARPAERDALMRVMQKSEAGVRGWDRRVSFLLQTGEAVLDPWGGAFCWPKECGGPADLQRLWEAPAVSAFSSVSLPRLSDRLLEQLADPRDWFSFLKGQFGKGSAFFPHMKMRIRARWVERLAALESAPEVQLEKGSALVDLVQDPSGDRVLLVTVYQKDLEAVLAHPSALAACCALDGEAFVGFSSPCTDVPRCLTPPPLSRLSQRVGWGRAALINGGEACLSSGEEVRWEDPTSFHLAVWLKNLEELLESSAGPDTTTGEGEGGVQERLREAGILMFENLTNPKVWSEVEDLLSRENAAERTQTPVCRKQGTSMAVLLRERRWMPGSVFASRDVPVSRSPSWLEGLPSDEAILPSLYAPASLLLPSAQVRTVFGSLVPLMPSSITRSAAGSRSGMPNAQAFASLTSALRVKETVSVDVALQVLAELAELDHRKGEMRVKKSSQLSDTVCASLRGLSDEKAGLVLTPIYEFLASEAVSEDPQIIERIRSEFSHLPLLFCPPQPVLESPLEPTVVTDPSTRFRKLHGSATADDGQGSLNISLFWEVSPACSSAFLLRPLCEVFGHATNESKNRLRSLFVDKLGVLPKPSEREAREALERVVSGGTVYASAWVYRRPRNQWQESPGETPSQLAAGSRNPVMSLLISNGVLSLQEVWKLSAVSKSLLCLREKEAPVGSLRWSSAYSHSSERGGEEGRKVRMYANAVLARDDVKVLQQLLSLQGVSEIFPLDSKSFLEKYGGSVKCAAELLKGKRDATCLLSRVETVRAAAAVSLLCLLARHLCRDPSSSQIPNEAPTYSFGVSQGVVKDTEKEAGEKRESKCWEGLQTLLGSLPVVPSLKGAPRRREGDLLPPHRLQWLRLKDLPVKAMALLRNGCKRRWGQSGVTPEDLLEQLQQSGLSWSDASFFLFSVPKVWPVPVQSDSSSAATLTVEDEREWERMLKGAGVTNISELAQRGVDDTRVVRVEEEEEKGLDTAEGTALARCGWRLRTCMALSLGVLPYLAEVAQRFLIAREPGWYLKVALHPNLRSFFLRGLQRIRMVPCAPLSLRQTVRVVFQGDVHTGESLRRCVVTQPGEPSPADGVRGLRLYMEVEGDVELEALKEMESRAERAQTVFRALSWQGEGEGEGRGPGEPESVSRALALSLCGFHFLQDFRFELESGEQTGVTQWVTPHVLDSLTECLQDVSRLLRTDGGVQAVEAFLKGVKKVPALPVIDSCGGCPRLDFGGDFVLPGFSDLSAEEAQTVAEFRWGDAVTEWVWRGIESRATGPWQRKEAFDEMSQAEGDSDADLLAELSGLRKAEGGEVGGSAWRDAQARTFEEFDQMCKAFKHVTVDASSSSNDPPEDEGKGKEGFMNFSSKLMETGSFEGEREGDGEYRHTLSVAPEIPHEPWWAFEGATQVAVERDDPVGKEERASKDLRGRAEKGGAAGTVEEEEETDIIQQQLRRDMEMEAPLVQEDVEVADDARERLVASFDSARHLLEKKSSLDMESLQDRWRTGRAGELFVFQFLKGECERGEWRERGVRPVWMNEEGESGEPYDIKLVQKRSAGSDEGGAGEGHNERVIAFIEVKASKVKKDGAHPLFSVSFNEWMFAQRAGDSLFIYRVHGMQVEEGGALLEVPEISRLQNPYGAWKRQKKPIYMVL